MSIPLVDISGTNTYLIGNESQSSRILLDTGEKDNQEYLSLLKGYLSENNLRISSVVVSHWHPDHVGGVPNLVKGLSLEGKNVQKLFGVQFFEVGNKMFRKFLSLDCISKTFSSTSLARREVLQNETRKGHRL